MAAVPPAPERRRPRRGSLERPVNGRLYRGTWLLVGLPLRHVLDVRHESFLSPDYLRLARRFGCTTVHTDGPQFPAIADEQDELAYVRLMRSEAACASGYEGAQLDGWAQGARAWTGRSERHEVFIYFINGAKERAPAAALELIRRVS